MSIKNTKVDTDCRILQIKGLSQRYWLLKVEAPELASRAKAGQFVNIRVQEGTVDPLLRTPLAVHRVQGNAVWFYFKKVGKATELLSQKETGQRIKVLGPLGNGFSLEGLAEEEAYLVSGGHGAAPMMFLAEELLERGVKPYFFLGGDKADSVIVARYFEEIGVEVNIATEDGSCGEKGFVTGCLEKFFQKKPPRGTLFACGPTTMLKAVQSLEKAPQKRQFSVDAYMACGIGACQGCTVRTKNGYKLACKDGPVFKAEELLL